MRNAVYLTAATVSFAIGASSVSLATTASLFPANIFNGIGQAIRTANETVIKALPPNELQVFNSLSALSIDTLYQVKVSPTPCNGGPVNCGMVAPDELKSLVDFELARRAADEHEQETAADKIDKRNNFLLSLGGLIVSVFAFGLSLFATLRPTDKKLSVET
jgi:hypothetical protein